MIFGIALTIWVSYTKLTRMEFEQTIYCLPYRQCYLIYCRAMCTICMYEEYHFYMYHLPLLSIVKLTIDHINVF